MEHIHGPMEESTKVTGKKENSMEKEDLQMQKERADLGCGNKVKS